MEFHVPTRKSKVYALRALKLISALSMKEATAEKKIDARGRYGRMRGEKKSWSREGNRDQHSSKLNSRVHVGPEGLSPGIK